MLGVQCVFILSQIQSWFHAWFVQVLWRLIVLLELFLKPEFFPRRHLAFTAKKTKEIEPHSLCGCPLSLCISTFLCEKLLETKIKDMSREALAGVKFQVTNGRKRRVWRERKGNVASFLLFSGFFLFPPQEVYVDVQYLKQSAFGIYSHSFPYDENHYHVNSQPFIFVAITPGRS